MIKADLIKKWEIKYDYYIKKADTLQDELAKLDVIDDQKEYQRKNNHMNRLYFTCVFISEFLKDLEKV